MDGGPDWPEEEGKNVARFVGSDDNGGAEVLRLKATQRGGKKKGVFNIFVHVMAAAPGSLLVSSLQPGT